MDNTALLNNIKNLCKENGTNIAQLEKSLGFGAGVISRWSKADPSLSKIVSIADYFSVSIDFLVGNLGSKINDRFMSALEQMTRNDSIQWREITYESGIRMTADAPLQYKFPVFVNHPDTAYVSIYYAKYNDGFISVCRFDDAVPASDSGPREYQHSELYIQADRNSVPVLQSEIPSEEVQKLWNAISGKKSGSDLITRYKEEITKKAALSQEYDRYLSHEINHSAPVDMQKLKESWADIQASIMTTNDLINRCMPTVKEKEKL